MKLSPVLCALGLLGNVAVMQAMSTYLIANQLDISASRFMNQATAAVVAAVGFGTIIEPAIYENGTRSLIRAILAHDNKQLDDLLKNRDTTWRQVDPNRIPYLPAYFNHRLIRPAAPILWTAKVGNIYACKALLNYKPFKGEKPVDIHATRRDGKTVLHLAVEEWLRIATIQSNKSLTKITTAEDTAEEQLLADRKQATQELIKLFIEHGAGITLLDKQVPTIFDLIHNKKDLSDLRKQEIMDFIDAQKYKAQ